MAPRKEAAMTEAEWLACTDPSSMLESLNNKASARKRRMFAIAWCRHEWHLLSDVRSQRAVEVAEAYADGLATVDALDAAYDAAYEAAYELDQPGLGSRRNSALYSAGNVAARNVSLPAFPAFEDGPIASQITIIRDIFGNPFRPVSLDPAWLTWNAGTVRKMAQAIYDDRAFDRLPILADALEEAGCTDRDILDHCRSGGDHVRGCWVIDLLLGKQ
jgi:hypothetical protein